MGSSDMLVDIYKTLWYHIPEDFRVTAMRTPNLSARSSIDELPPSSARAAPLIQTSKLFMVDASFPYTFRMNIYKGFWGRKKERRKKKQNLD